MYSQYSIALLIILKKFKTLLSPYPIDLKGTWNCKKLLEIIILIGLNLIEFHKCYFNQPFPIRNLSNRINHASVHCFTDGISLCKYNRILFMTFLCSPAHNKIPVTKPRIYNMAIRNCLLNHLNVIGRCGLLFSTDKTVSTLPCILKRAIMFIH